MDATAEEISDRQCSYQCRVQQDLQRSPQGPGYKGVVKIGIYIRDHFTSFLTPATCLLFLLILVGERDLTIQHAINPLLAFPD
jgi:hypothetical protein